jgi:tetratricopeptide (TPR) repeat protein/NAD-dependent SIR2 family protein deacetylase
MAKKKPTFIERDHITIRELAKKLKSIDRYVKNPRNLSSAEERRPQLAFFLGAGASFESGIMLAGQMMKIFKDEIFDTHCQELTTDKEKADWLKNQDWYNSGREEYGCLFEKAFETKTERQRFIEDMIADKAPSFGYVILADLLLRNYVNTVLTTNFDDLVYISSTTFTGNRPIVYAYGILASEMKMLSNHSKVLKLHGDYLYSNIVNTSDEMSKQSQALKEPYNDIKEAISSLNMERQVRTVFDNFGVIVIGYSGGDKNVMKLLGNVSEDNGFYWCYVKGDNPDEEVCNLVESKNGKFIEIEGFDALMKGISDVTEFKIEDLLKSIDERKEKLKEAYVKFDEKYNKESLKEYAEELKVDIAENPNEKLSANDYFIMGYEEYNKTNYVLAEQYFRESIKLNPNNAFVYTNLGSLLCRYNSNLDEAEILYKKAIEIDPKDYIAYYNLGCLLYKDKSRWDDAEVAYKKAIAIYPNYTQAYNNLGLLLADDKSRFNDAEVAYNKAIEINPNNAEVYNNLGLLLTEDKNRWNDAEVVYNKAIMINPNGVEVYYNLGNLLTKDENRWKDAEVAYNKVIELNPNDAEAYLNLGALLSKDNSRLKDAEVACIKAIELNPNLAQAYNNLAIIKAIHVGEGARDKIIENLRKCIEINPSYKERIKNNSNFDFIRDDPRFVEIIGE